MNTDVINAAKGVYICFRDSFVIKWSALLLVLIFSVYTANAQNGSNKDSILIYLNSIQSKTDTVALKSVYDWLYKEPTDILFKEDVMKHIYRLENIVSDNNYFDMAYTYLARLISINTKEANEKAIYIGKDFFENYTGTKSRYGHYVYLSVLRDLRHPYRNLGKLNESIEYYTNIEKKYLLKNDSDVVSIANNVLSSSYLRLGISEKAYYHQKKSIAYLNDAQTETNTHWAATLFGIDGKFNRYAVLSSYYLINKQLSEADSCLLEAKKYYHKLENPMANSDVPFLFLQIALSKTLAGASNSQTYYDTAFFYIQKYNSHPIYFATYFQEKGVDLSRQGLLDSSLYNFRRSRQIIDSFNLPVSTIVGQLTPDYYEAEVAIKIKNYALAIKLLHRQLNKLENLNLRPNTIQALLLLSKAYALSGKTNEAYLYMQQAFAMKENVLKDEQESRSLSFEMERKMQDNDAAIMMLNTKNESNRKIKYYFISIISLLSLLAMALTFFYINKGKTGKALSAQNARLTHTLEQLKSAQAQLIQSEKMASLGVLTAGIAHEIQNPLNFVNNFSEVSNELMEELHNELNKGDIEEAKYLSNDIKQNLEKINHHGKRASSIVKGMLEHSRTNSGTKEPTDINTLADESLRLAYHGLRAKDKDFNASMETHFDLKLPKIDIIQQDIGRVLLNLINNAFYVVNERSKKEEAGYEPKVTITTQQMSSGELHIAISDNGSGIPDAIKDKIFQPFFTTKPTGQGTGLGLSLAYDIVKAHGSELKVESKEDKGSQFHFILPYFPAENKVDDITPNIVQKNAAVEIKGVKILLVEDNAFNIVISTDELKESIEDVHIDVAENGLIALEKIKLSTYDIILMDIQMPVMSGYEATRNIRNMKSEKAKTPIIAMTAYLHKEEIDLCYEAGMNDFIGKPFNTEELISKIQNLVKK